MTLNSQKPTVVSLYCGAGGLDYGFSKAGFEIILGIDVDSNSCKTYINSLNTKTLNTDIRKINAHSLPDSDVIIGSLIISAPFAISNKYLVNEHTEVIIEILKIKKPKAIVFESVKGLLNFQKGSLFKYLINEFTLIGYDIKYSVLNSVNYGMAQKKERLIIVGILDNGLGNKYEFPSEINGVVNLKHVLGDFEKNIEEYEKVSNVNFLSKRNHILLNLESVAPTLFYRHIYYLKHKDYFVRLTSKDAAAIQSFPKSFEFIGNEASKFRQIVSAFPPKLAFFVAKELFSIFNWEANKGDSLQFDNDNDNVNVNEINVVMTDQLKIKNNSNLDIKKNMERDLSSIKPGTIQASDYHEFIFKNLKYIFDKDLRRGKKEVKINGGRKRIDITFDNTVGDGFFSDLKNLYDIKSAKILIECKNYSSDLENPEFDQLLGRFNKKYGEFGILVCRNIFDKSKNIDRCKDIVNSGKGWVIMLSDKDINALLSLRGKNDYEGINDYMSDLFNEIIL
ncbi:DNA cytosine methyltransferase [Lysinibacillus sp. NPDC048646]|uniref:DNA cytosine methyltransferase n=1 Tax=Lysinibacillus sp. NPDC048646 TaxID=3390574 RepID=UPI003D03BD90